MDPVIVVGAGLSGVACARVLADAGRPVVVLDRGRRIGGRMAVRRLGDRPVDLGASYLTVSDPGFADVVERWREAGLARPWTDTFHVLEAGEAPVAKSGPVRWGTPGGLRTLVEDLATGLDVRRRTVAGVGPAGSRLQVDGAHASAVVLAMPDAQAARLLAADAPEREALDRPSEPVIALVATYAERTWDLDGTGFDGAFVNGDDVLDFVADDGRRRGDGAPVLVAHSTSDFAAGHLEQPQGALPAMVEALGRVLGVDDGPLHTHVHRWSLAKPADPPRDAPFLLGDRLIGACGDGWGPQSKVEGAWLSGTALGRELVGRTG